MKERKGAFGRTVDAVTQGIAGAARRRAEQREPRVLVYDADGDGRLLAPESPHRDALAETAARLVATATGRPPEELEPPPDDEPL